MLKLYYLFIAVLLLCGFSACQKGGGGNSISPNAAKLILGKWNLQQQKSVIYVNGAVQIDTTYLTSFTNISRAQFNKDNTFNSVGLWTTGITDGNLGNGNIPSAGMDSTSGTYHIVNSSLNTNVAIAGFSNMKGFYDAATSVGTISPVNVVSRSSQIMVLTSSKFNLHYELVYNTIINNVTTNYKEEEDYYYTR
jgi:hypothetical protein